MDKESLSCFNRDKDRNHQEQAESSSSGHHASQAETSSRITEREAHLLAEGQSYANMLMLNRAILQKFY